MPDEYLQSLQDAEQTFSHKIDLLNEVIQDLNRIEEASHAYSARHPDHASTGHTVADALRSLQDLLHRVVDQHNQVVAVIAEKKQEVEKHKQEADAYQPDTI